MHRPHELRGRVKPVNEIGAKHNVVRAVGGKAVRISLLELNPAAVCSFLSEQRICASSSSSSNSKRLEA